MRSHLQNLGDKGWYHGANHCAVVGLERDLGTNGHFVVAQVQNEMVTAGPDNLDSRGRGKAFWIGILMSDCQNCLRDKSAILESRLGTKRSLADIAPWLRWFDLGLDHSRDECHGIGVESMDRLAMERLHAEQD